MATDLCLRVLKFSHALGVRADNSIPWTHLQASDIFAVVKGQDTHKADGKLSLDVVQGTTVLERLNVAQYIDSAKEVRRGAEAHGIRLETEQLPIFGITKDALLALRYRHEPDGKQKRIQLRFEDATHCLTLVTTFVQRGMEFQAQRPGTARTSTARPTTSSAPDRLLTANSSSPYFDAEQASQRRVTSHQQPSYHNARWPATASQSQNGPSHIAAVDQARHEHASQDMGPPRFFSRDETTAPREAVPERPSTSQIYRSYTTPSQQTQNEPQEIIRRPSDPAGARPSSTSHVSHQEATRDAVEETATPPRTAFDTAQGSVAASLVSPRWSSGTPEPAARNSQRSDPMAAPSSPYRPSTAATTLPPEQYELPPVRVLPFKQPSSKSSNTEPKSVKPKKPSMVMPRLPVSAVTQATTALSERTMPPSSHKKAAGSRPATSSPLKRSSDAIPDAESEQVSSPAKKPRTSHGAKPTTDQTLRKPSGMQALLNNHKPLSERSINTTIARTNSLADAPHEIESPTHSPSKLRTNQTASSSLPSTITGHNETSLEEYATQSLQDRQAVLEDFMMSNLENPAFTKLCEDVENCWRRIALGL